MSARRDSLLLGISQQRVQRTRSFAHWQDLQAARVQAAVEAGAQLLVFPEYGSLELTAHQAESVRLDLRASLLVLQERREEFQACWAALACQHQIAVLAPSFPWLLADGSFRNRALLLTPDALGWQDKLTMTRFESEHWGISAGSELVVFEYRGLRFGVQICYDAEFPQPSRRLYEAGIELLLVPSCTDSRAGYQRVRTGCKARALEQQMIVAQAPLTGRAEWSPAIDVNVGRAALYGPSDRGFPASGVIARAVDGLAEWLIAEADLTTLRALRADPSVWNARDWTLQQRPETGPARAIRV